jgi:hypothetical protein
LEVLAGAAITTFNAAIHGNSGDGKTTLATSLPFGPESRWGERAIYVALDTNSEALESVLRPNRARLIVVKPSSAKNAISGRLEMNFHKEIFAIANTPWRERYPDAKTMIWDTGTTAAEWLLRQYANTAVFSGSDDKHITVGTRGSGDFFANPMQGDYGMVQSVMLQLIAQSVMQIPPMNQLWVFQSDWTQPEGGGDLVIGPGTVGGKAINKVMKEFSNVFRMECRTSTVPSKDGTVINNTTYKVYTAKRGAAHAKFRYPLDKGVNPMPEFVVDAKDPSAFWRRIDEVTLG